jgi:tetratricopeptide (TPR) repeat protein
LTFSSKTPVYLVNHPAIEDRISLLENIMQIESKPQGPFKTVENFKWIQTEAFVEEREPSVAVSYFESIVKTNPDDVAGLFGLGVAFQRMGRLDRSIEVLQNAISLAPQKLEISKELGVSYFLSGKLDQAIETLETMQSLSGKEKGQKDDLLSLYYLGRAYQEKGDFTKALPFLLRVQKEMPDFVEVHYHLGSVYGRMGKKGESHFYFGKHFKLREDMKNALLQFQKALEWLERESPEGEETRREIKELTQPTKKGQGKNPPHD